jgi:hypothetical protein
MMKIQPEKIQKMNRIQVIKNYQSLRTIELIINDVPSMSQRPIVKAAPRKTPNRPILPKKIIIL